MRLLRAFTGPHQRHLLQEHPGDLRYARRRHAQMQPRDAMQERPPSRRPPRPPRAASLLFHLHEHQGHIQRHPDPPSLQSLGTETAKEQADDGARRSMEAVSCSGVVSRPPFVSFL